VTERKVLLGNEAIAYGLIEAGCSVATSYPGTPASEILGTLLHIKNKEQLPHLYAEWSVNEKVAFEIALAASYTGLRAAVMMKQVGLNVASDPLMSSAYTGTKGGFVIISADDPGPHSSQTEQDSRFFAMFAKIPVFDPASPREAKEMIQKAFELSEKLELPVMLRPTTRICHARQDVTLHPFPVLRAQPHFEKNPQRWAATPKFRFLLHKALNRKIEQLSRTEEIETFRLLNENGEASRSKRCIVSSGIATSYACEVLESLGLWEKIPMFQVLMPYPISTKFLEILSNFEEVLVIEETYPVIELQIRNGTKLLGRESGHIPKEGELTPEKVENIISSWLGLRHETTVTPDVPQRRPTLCPGCGHRPVFFAIRKCFPKGIYPSDIGCYTLGLNIGSVDTVLCMGSAISQAAGFYRAFSLKENSMPPIVATIGDSTFFHAGIPPLIDAVTYGASFVLVILDNETTAMTGHQPTPETVSETRKTSIEDIVKACGVSFIEVVDAYNLRGVMDALKRAGMHAFEKKEGIAVIIARCPCVTDRKQKARIPGIKVQVTDKCRGCQLCVQRFECPAIESQGRKQPVKINEMLCVGCGVCVEVCPFGGLVLSQ
jgi:indolepyruvate ferredoxin oxidoreductase alpha subunit